MSRCATSLRQKGETYCAFDCKVLPTIDGSSNGYEVLLSGFGRGRFESDDRHVIDILVRCELEPGGHTAGQYVSKNDPRRLTHPSIVTQMSGAINSNAEQSTFGSGIFGAVVLEG